MFAINRFANINIRIIYGTELTFAQFGLTYLKRNH